MNIAVAFQLRHESQTIIAPRVRVSTKLVDVHIVRRFLLGANWYDLGTRCDSIKRSKKSADAHVFFDASRCIYQSAAPATDRLLRTVAKRRRSCITTPLVSQHRQVNTRAIHTRIQSCSKEALQAHRATLPLGRCREGRRKEGRN